ncbi:hypothetical protein ABIA96_004184 [Bradyrhizobium sp. LB11.1]
MAVNPARPLQMVSQTCGLCPFRDNFTRTRRRRTGGDSAKARPLEALKIAMVRSLQKLQA